MNEVIVSGIMQVVMRFFQKFMAAPEITGLVQHKFMLAFALASMIGPMFRYMAGRDGLLTFVQWAATVALVSGFVRLYVPIVGSLQNGFNDVANFVQILALGNDSVGAPYEAVAKASGTIKTPPFTWSEIAAFAWRAIIAFSALALSFIFMAYSVAYFVLGEFTILSIVAVMYLTAPALMLPSLRWIFTMMLKAFVTAGLFIILLRMSLAIGVLVTTYGVTAMQPAALATAYPSDQWGSIGPLLVSARSFFVGLATAHAPLVFIPIVFRGVPAAGTSLLSMLKPTI
jgi:hypothetical protein